MSKHKKSPAVLEHEPGEKNRMTAATIAKALGGRKAGSAWMARCPAHDDREPSLSIADGDDGKVLVRCHAGCEQHRVIAALKARGIWHISGQRRAAANTIDLPSSTAADRTKAALRIFKATSPASGTLVETYLRSRNIIIPPPATLRFHAALKHPAGQRWPAMVALVAHGVDGRRSQSIAPFSLATAQAKRQSSQRRWMLGPSHGGAVRLGPVGERPDHVRDVVVLADGDAPGEAAAQDAGLRLKRLLIAEGIETALSAMQATRQPAWAALSTSGLRTLELRQGRRVRIARPPRGFDFNDVLLGRASNLVEGVA